MKMDEYLKKKNEIQDKQKGLQDRMNELDEAKKKAKEIEDSIRVEKKRASEANKCNFTMMGMQFRPWTLNDMVIILFIVAILVVGGVSFIPEEDMVVEPVVEEEDSNPVDFDVGIKYKESLFSTINVTNVDTLWYTLDLKNKESFNIKCNI